MPQIFSREAIRDLDRRAIEVFAIPGLILMENAGRGVARIARSMGPGPVLIVCGTGNNGGDALVAARHLANASFAVEIALVGDPARVCGDAGINLEIARRVGLGIQPVHDERGVGYLRDSLDLAALIIDAIFGTGLDRPIAGYRASLIEAINARRRTGATTLAVDLPSGLDADTGEILGVCVRADVTATLVGHKRGFFSPLARPNIGRIEVVDIGVPIGLVRELADGG